MRETISQEAKNFIRKMMEYDPHKRITAEQAIKDPWIVKNTDSATQEVPLIMSALENMRNFRVNLFFLLNK